MTPIISVVIPTYNSAKTILDTIASVQAQTLREIEILVINDGSTDDLLERLDPLLVDDRIKVYSYPNGGLPVARNRGIDRAIGEYIAFIDADDLWTADKLAAQLQALRMNSRAGLAYSLTYFMEADGQRYHRDCPIGFQGNILKDLLRWNFLRHGSNPLIRRTVIDRVGNFDPTLPSAEDWDYWLRIAQHYEFALVPQPQIYYRQSLGSMSSKIEVMEAAQLEVVDRAFKFAPSELQGYRPESMAKIYQYSAQLYLIHGKTPKTNQLIFQKLWRSISLYPAIFLERKTQTLICKAILLSLIPWTWAKQLLRQFSKNKSQPVT
jgi:glycosyltransferase involved in cell wall biosynthesis